VTRQELRLVRIERRVDGAIGNVSLLTLSDQLMKDEPGLEESAYDVLLFGVPSLVGTSSATNNTEVRSFVLGAWWWWTNKR
jgi:hypothetical protein